MEVEENSYTVKFLMYQYKYGLNKLKTKANG